MERVSDFLLWAILTVVFSAFILTFIPMPHLSTALAVTVGGCLGGMVAYVFLMLLMWWLEEVEEHNRKDQ